MPEEKMKIDEILVSLFHCERIDLNSDLCKICKDEWIKTKKQSLLKYLEGILVNHPEAVEILRRGMR